MTQNDLLNKEKFELIKYHLISSENDLEDYIERKKQRKGIPEYALLVNKSSSKLVEITRINSEIIEYKFKINNKEEVKQFFTHVDPTRMYLPMASRGKKECLVHFIYEDEPITRDWWTMLIANQQKKREKLEELGCVIKHDNWDQLMEYFYTVNEEGTEIFGKEQITKLLYKKSPTGYVFKPEWAGFDPYGLPRPVYDISDIDAMKEEIAQTLESEVVKEWAKAVILDPYSKTKKQLEMIVLFLVCGWVISLMTMGYFISNMGGV